MTTILENKRARCTVKAARGLTRNRWSESVDGARSVAESRERFYRRIAAICRAGSDNERCKRRGERIRAGEKSARTRRIVPRPSALFPFFATGSPSSSTMSSSNVSNIRTTLWLLIVNVWTSEIPSHAINCPRQLYVSRIIRRQQFIYEASSFRVKWRGIGNDRSNDI